MYIWIFVYLNFCTSEFLYIWIFADLNFCRSEFLLIWVFVHLYFYISEFLYIWILVHLNFCMHELPCRSRVDFLNHSVLQTGPFSCHGSTFLIFSHKSTHLHMRKNIDVKCEWILYIIQHCNSIYAISAGRNHFSNFSQLIKKSHWNLLLELNYFHIHMT